MGDSRQYMVVHEDVFGDEEVFFVLTDQDPETFARALRLYRVILCTEIDEIHELVDAAVDDPRLRSHEWLRGVVGEG
jgi:hypothetical protein